MFVFFQSLFQSLLNGINSGLQWFGGIFTGFFDGIKNFFTNLFGPIVYFLLGLGYLFSSIFNIIVLTVQVVLGLLGVILAVVGGVINTFSGLMGFSGSTSYYVLPSAYQQGFTAVTGFLSNSGFNTLAYIMASFIWMGTAYAVIKIAGGNGG